MFNTIIIFVIINNIIPKIHKIHSEFQDFFQILTEISQIN